MITQGYSAANFTASQVNTVVEVISDEEYVQVRLHSPQSTLCYVRAERRSPDRASLLGMLDVAKMIRHVATICSVDVVKHLLIALGFSVVQ